MIEKYPASKERIFTPKDIEKSAKLSQKFKNIQPKNR